MHPDTITIRLGLPGLVVVETKEGEAVIEVVARYEAQGAPCPSVAASEALIEPDPACGRYRGTTGRLRRDAASKRVEPWMGAINKRIPPA